MLCLLDHYSWPCVRLESTFRRKSQIWIKAYSPSPSWIFDLCCSNNSFYFTFVSPCRCHWCVCVNHSMCVCVFVLQCKLEQQACLTGKDLTLKCSGLCPCPTAAPTSKESKHGKMKHTQQLWHRINIYYLLLFVLYFCLKHTWVKQSSSQQWARLIYIFFLRPLQRAAPGRIWLISGSVWGTGSSFCRPMPSRTTIASPGPEPLQPAPHQVRATVSWIPTALRGS